MIIGPTMPPPSSSQPPISATQLSGESPIPSSGSQPTSMNRAVMKPQAMNAPMLGITMLERNVPNFCTRTRAPEPAAGVVVVAMLMSSSRA